jgi:hypothetical protein
MAPPARTEPKAPLAKTAHLAKTAPPVPRGRKVPKVPLAMTVRLVPRVPAAPKAPVVQPVRKGLPVPVALLRLSRRRLPRRSPALSVRRPNRSAMSISGP